MKTEFSEKRIFVQPGYIYVLFEPAILYTALGSGGIIAIFDKIRRFGGMIYYIHPIAQNAYCATAHYAFPGVVHMVNMFIDAGSHVSDLEAHLFGGAENFRSANYTPEIGAKNIQIGRRILELKRVVIISEDTGLNRGRKVAFHSGTGEVLVAKVDRIREDDWYPQLPN